MRSTLFDTKRRAIPLILVGALVVVTLAAALGSAVSAPPAIERYGNEFKPLPKKMLFDGEILFARLPASRLATVRTTPNEAIGIAESRVAPAVHGTRVVLVSLGGYVDRNRIVHDWIGTKTLVPRAVPSYLVRIFEPYVVTLGPSTNHYWNVVVNAQSGKVISAFTYD
jgi:hypothetical protein